MLGLSSELAAFWLFLPVTVALICAQLVILSVAHSIVFDMRILHTSDWHVGRTFHGHQTLEHLGEVLRALADLVSAHQVDVVVIAGDVFDSAVPNAAATELLGQILSRIIRSGAQVVLTSGNHDSASRLGYLANFTAASGLHICTDPTRLDTPITIADPSGGEVLFFGIPFLEPTMIRHLAPGVEIENQVGALCWALDRIRNVVPKEARYVVVAHTFVVAGGTVADRTNADKYDADNVADDARTSAFDTDKTASALDAPRDFTRGGVDCVPATVFHGASYVALGHVHGRQQINERVRYSGAPLYYSFGEEGRKRGAWLVELASDGQLVTDWLELPIPRPIKHLTGKLTQLLTDSAFTEFTNHWLKATLTDNTRPVDAMRLLQQRFPYCAEVEYRPTNQFNDGQQSYAARIKSLTDAEITDKFLAHVRNGEGATPTEAKLISALIQAS